VGLTTWNAALFLRSQGEKRAVETQMRELADEDVTLKERRAAVQAELAGKDIEPLTTRVAAANSVLAQRAVSWTLLLERLEEVLPWSAALSSISTNMVKDGVRLNFAVRARTYEDALDFIDNLERSPCFSDAYPSGEQEKDNEFQIEIEADHDPFCGQDPPGAPLVTARGRSSRG
jgi:Tfp pilus assembly protein PilN